MAVSLPTFFSPYRLAGWLLLLIGLAGCSLTPPQGITPVSPFDVNRYAGKWYEIARLDHRFERGLTDNNATYSVQADGSVEVINRGYDTEDRQWKQVTGKVKEQWGKLTDDDIKVIDGKQEQLVGRIQERYGVAKDEAEKQVQSWIGRM